MSGNSDKEKERRLSELFSAVEKGKGELDEKVMAEVRERSVREFEACSSDGDAQAVKRTVFIWRIVMESKMTKVAVAAVIVIVVGVGINYYGGSVDVASVAWADVAERIEQMPSHIVRARMVGRCEGEETPFMELDLIKYYSAEYGMREEMYDAFGNMANQIYILAKEKISVTVVPVLKEFKVVALSDEQLRMFGMSMEQVIEQLKSDRYTELGRKMVDGVVVEGIEFGDARFLTEAYPFVIDSVVARLWVDIETNLPVQMEAEIVSRDKFATIWTGGKPLRAEAVVDEFEWDAELDWSTFEPNIPDDYVLVSDEMDSADEGKAVVGLETFGELTAGAYPSELDMMTVLQEGCPVIQGYIDEVGDCTLIEDEIEEMRNMLLSVKATCLLYAELVREGKDVAYYGDSVSVGDEGQVLMRWKVSDDEYRVIFGDLTAENVGEEQLVELEKSTSE